ncbi:hypothetical protein [Paraburkholderia pallida]|uniref:hypothetical protein n=1 Tax=Paraburkholderia pallida TaxID=2547399 RepID=UPI001E5B4D9C|nr:hypothetical protein [Paraburkholderia pallida]
MSQSAATPAGCDPPATQPKKRGPAVPIKPGPAAAASCSIASLAGMPLSGVGPPNASSNAAKPAVAAGGRVARVR